MSPWILMPPQGYGGHGGAGGKPAMVWAPWLGWDLGSHRTKSVPE